MRSSNPIFTNLEKTTFSNSAETATKTGITIKTIILLLTTLVTGFFSVQIATALPEPVLYAVLIGSGILAFIAVMLATFVPKTALVMSIVYALLQGFVYGLITWILESIFPGVAVTALLGTGTVFTVMFILYNTGLLRGSALLRSVVLGSLLTFIVGSLILSVTSLVNPGFIESFYSFDLAVGISLFLIVIGALMLTLDFERAENVVNMGLPKSAEWNVALGFMITLIWIYYNILRLAVTIMARNNN